MKKLKPCPFCGNKDILVFHAVYVIGGSYAWCVHGGCGAKGPEVLLNKIPDYPEEQQDLAIEKWNTRGDRASAVCFNCGEAYTPHRLPSKSRRNYCPECRARGVPVRDASRDYYRRKIGKEG